MEIRLAGLGGKLRREKEGNIKAGPQIPYRDGCGDGGTSMEYQNNSRFIEEKDEFSFR